MLVDLVIDLAANRH